MKILVFGRNGQLGWELQHTLATLGDVLAVDRAQLDLRDASVLQAFVRMHQPHVIINAAAYTAVDRAEQERDLAFEVNGRAPGIMAEQARLQRAGLVHVSTDYVFDGTLGRPYVESDTPVPLNVYGQSKLAGEQAIQQAGGAYIVLRTSWVYSLRRDSFVTKVLTWARNGRELRVVVDQVSNPTSARSLAEMIKRLLLMSSRSPYDFFEQYAGLYHLAGRGYASRFEWAESILALASKQDPGLVSSIQPAHTDEFPAPAKRPLFSALDCTRFESKFGMRLPEWRSALELEMKEMLKQPE
ncbi:MAG: dTDP-4-dehydrorhamnose reductase [Chloroflexota bacterium]